MTQTRLGRGWRGRCRQYDLRCGGRWYKRAAMRRSAEEYADITLKLIEE